MQGKSEAYNKQNEGNNSRNQRYYNSGRAYYNQRRPYAAANNSYEEEKELSSKQLVVQNKRFFVDIKQNSRGKFVKMAEIATNGRKSRIIMALPCAVEFDAALGRLIEIYDKLEPHDPNAVIERSMAQPTLSGKQPQPPNFVEGRLGTETVTRDSRRYYLDLKENQRGRFLRITMTTQRTRVSLAYPAQGMAELRSTLTAMLTEHSSEEDMKDERGELMSQMQSKTLRADRRMFYFDVGASRAGLYLRVSEVRPTYRTAVILPQYRWEAFRDLLNFYIEKGNKVKETNGDTKLPEQVEKGEKEEKLEKVEQVEQTAEDKS